jgi:peptidyl-prolyl cis-trans isomerase A (cyclophilin A)
MRTFLATLLVSLLVPAAAGAETRAPSTGPAVIITTSEGPIRIELAAGRAPLTVANFLRYVDEKRFDGTSFYRALKIGGRSDLGLVQGGIRADPKRALPPVAHEPTSATGLSHTNGAISMARGAPGSAQGDFFIIIGEVKTLDANPAAEGDNQGFAVFGHVSEGMETVARILEAPVSATAGEGAMKGQMIEKPVKIVSVRRTY